MLFMQSYSALQMCMLLIILPFCHQMNKDKPKSSRNAPTDTRDNKVGQLFPNASLEDYARLNGVKKDHDDSEIWDSKCDDSDDEDDNSENEDCAEDEDYDDNKDNVPDQNECKK